MKLLKYIALALLSAFLFINTIQSQDTTNRHEEVKFNKAYVKSYFIDSWDIVKSPIRWSGKQWACFGGLAGVAALVYTQDEVIRDAFQRNRSDAADDASQYVFEPLGKGVITIPLSIGFWAVGEITDNNRASRAGLTSLKAITVTAVFTYAFKFAFQRHRPLDNEPPNPRIWEGPFGSYSHTSFPSGHSSVVFAAAAVFASEYRETIWVPIMSYTLASLAAVSRVYDDKHWASDVLIGSALGFFIGKFIYKSTLNNPNLAIIPGVSSGGQPGFTMLYRLR